MTTSQSPLRVLKAQADKIANAIKMAERGEPVEPAFAAKLAEARGRTSFKIGIVMDDKLVTIEIPWPTIRETTEVSLGAYILRLMRGERQH